MERHSKLTGALLLIAGFFVAFAISENIADLAPTFGRSIGFAGGGAAMAAVDLGVRRVWGEGDRWTRYFVARTGPGVSILPVWAAGLFMAFVGLVLPVK